MKLGLYLHVPFCAAICSYCNFNRGLLDAALKRRYVDALAREILDAGDGRAADTIFFGGGTPSLLDASEVARLIGACRDAYAVTDDAEITLEANPETLTERTLEAFRAAGVTRLSVGVQSFDDGELVRLGRVHSAARAREALRWARGAGFANVSLDLMVWLPGQTRASWLASVEDAIALAPDHLSLYLLELYPNAPLKEAMARAPRSDVAWAQTTDDDAADMYLDGLDCLDRAGFDQYEISNVARPGFASRHNLKYWQSGDWRGFGCGAHSTVGPERWHNLAATADYVERIQSGASVRLNVHHRSEAERVEETLFTGLRLSSGIDEGNFLSRYGVDPWSRYGEALASFVEHGYMWRRDASFGLTRRGMLVANEVLATFV